VQGNEPFLALPPWVMWRIIRVMRSMLFALILFGASLVGQPGSEDKSSACKKLQPILIALKSPAASRPLLTSQLVEAMMALTTSDRQPSRSTVVNFADELTGALIGRDFTNQVDALQQSVCEVLSGSTTNLKSSGRLEVALTAIGIDRTRKETVTRLFMAIGKEVRGPDGFPVSDGFPPPRKR
jgi:hypothetical protein